jgi:2-keto-4-pentenoate hydratase/2-oxohepta-3-ene-1,7-dioic acid hydratase in catechol pathway
VIGLLLLFAAGLLAYYLFRPLPIKPVPASFHPYDLERGGHVPLEPPPEIFAIGLSYAGHIEETALEFDPEAMPPVFRKDLRTFVPSGARVAMPGTDELCAAAEELEPGLGDEIRNRFGELPALLDYEGELGFVLLEDVDFAQLDKADYAPRLGFFLANDISARSLAILGEGRPNRYDYWGVSKSFAGFMPVAGTAWVPDKPLPNGIPVVEIETRVNGELRQKQSTDQLIYTPVRMLRFIHATFPGSPLQRGTMFLTGTPAGVAIKSPRWQVRGANLVGMSRFRKLAIKLAGDTSSFLAAGDRVEVRGGVLGEVSAEIGGD